MSVADRAKHQVALYGRTVSLIILVVGMLAIGGAAYVYLTPGVEELPSRETDTQDFESSIEHSAVVVNNTTLYETGQRLEDQPRYFFDSTPVLNLSAVAVVPDDRPVTISHRIVVSTNITADGRTLIERRRILAADQETVEDGEFVVNATMNATRIRANVSKLEDAAGGLGDVSTQLRLQTTYETESTKDDTYEGTLRDATAIQLASEGYWLEDDLSASSTENTIVGGGIRQQDPNMSFVSGLVTLGLFTIALSGVLAYWSSRKVDLQELKMRIDRAQYSDWISAGDLPTSQDKQYVYIDTLEDVVDIGIDTNNRVIYDSEIGVYAVPDGSIIYYHAPDPRSVSSWLDIS